MFFSDPRAAVLEMSRVLKVGGRLAIAVWDALENTPGYDRVVDLLSRLFGDPIADLLRAPYSLGDPDLVRSLIEHPTLLDVRVERLPGTAAFPSIRAWMHTDVRGWTLSDRIDERQFERLVLEAERVLAEFAIADGSVRFSHPAIVATGARASA